MIGLTIMAYRLEGLREYDWLPFQSEDRKIKSVGLLQTVCNNVEEEVGTFSERASNKMYEAWVAAAGGKLLSGFGYDEQDAEAEEESGNRHEAEREKMIFPDFTPYQPTKLSASGQELGSSLMFQCRIGFSGTPSDLLPDDLGQCRYEQGAIVTGLTNQQTARFLLEHGPDQWLGCVYFEEGGKKMILERAGPWRTLKLEESTIPKEGRFTFYDQVQ
eukprot:gene57696-biopygen85638